MFTLLNIFIISTTIFFLPIKEDAFWLPKNLLFVLFGLIFIGANYLYKRNRNFSNKWLGLILIYISLHFGWVFIKPMLFSGVEGKMVWNLWNFLPTINGVIAILLIQILVENTDNLRRWLDLSKVLCWTAFILSLYAILQYIGIDQIFGNFKWILFTRSGKMTTFFGNSMQTSTYLAIISPMCLMFKDLRYKLFYLVISFAIFMTQSYLGIVVFIIGLLSYLIFTKKFKLAFIGILFCVVSFIVFLKLCHGFFDMYGKLGIYKQVFIDGCKVFFTGSGIGSFPIFNYKINVSWLRDLGFEYLQVFREGGIILVVLISGYLINLGYRIFNTEKSMLLIGYSASMIAFLIAGLGGYTLHLAPLSLIGIIYISGLEAQTMGG